MQSNAAEELKALKQRRAGLEEIRQLKLRKQHLLDSRGSMEQTPKSESSIGKSLAKGARNVLAGVGDTADFIASPIREGLNLGASALGYGRPFNPIGESVAQGIDTATGGYTAPESGGDKMTEGAIRAASGLIPGAAAGNLIAKGAGSVAKTLGPGLANAFEVSPANVLGSGTGAALTEGVLANTPDQTGQAITSGILGNLAGQTVGGILSPGGVARGVGKGLQINPKKVKNFEEAGIRPTLGDVSDSDITRGYQKIAQYVPGSSHLIKGTREKQLEEISNVLGKGAKGESLSERQAGELTQSALKKYKEKGNQVVAELKDNYQRHLPEGAAIDINKPLDFYTKTLTKVKSNRMRQEIAKSPFGKEMNKLAHVADQFDGKVPWNDAEAARSQLLDLITRQGSVGTISKGQVEHLRGLLNKEMTDYMKDKGPKAIHDWNRYNKFYANWAQKRKPLLDMAEDVHIDSAEKVFGELVKGKKPDTLALETANQALKGKDRLEVFDTLVNRLGQNRVGEWVPNEFQKNYKKLQMEGKDQLKLPLSKSSREKFDKIIDVIGDMKLTESMANTSRTETTKRLIDVATTIGSFTNAIPTLTGLAATHAISKGMLVNPRFINWAAKGTTLKNPLQWGHHLGQGLPFLGRVGVQEMKSIIDHYQKEDKNTKK